MIKVLVGVSLCLLGAAMTSGCEVHSEPAVVVRPAKVVVRPAPVVVVQPAPVVVRSAPVVVYQPVLVEPKYKYKHKHKRHYEGDQGEDE